MGRNKSELTDAVKRALESTKPWKKVSQREVSRKCREKEKKFKDAMVAENKKMTAEIEKL